MSQPVIRDNSFFPRRLWLLAVNIGLLCIVAATALPLLGVWGIGVRTVYSAGALMVVAGRVFAPSAKGQSLRVRRLCRLEVWAGLIFCAGAFFAWYTPERMDWIAFTLAGAVVQIYVSMALPRAVAKAEDKKRG